MPTTDFRLYRGALCQEKQEREDLNLLFPSIWGTIYAEK
jgi:hypothetical protein